jgi:hypothetical protein
LSPFPDTGVILATSFFSTSSIRIIECQPFHLDESVQSLLMHVSRVDLIDRSLVKEDNFVDALFRHKRVAGLVLLT